MNKIIEELVKKGIPVTMEYDKQTERIEYVVDGFYKSGTIKLADYGDGLKAYSRYNREDEIVELRDIVYLNYDWWISSNGRYDGWGNPVQMWIPLLIEEGFIEEKKEVKVSYTPK